MTDYAGNPDNFPANVRLVDDGTDRNATTLAAEGEDLADRTAWLKQRVSAMLADGHFSFADGTLSGDDPTIFETITSSSFVKSSTGHLELPECKAGDLLLIWYHIGHVNFTNGTVEAFDAKVYVTEDEGGGGEADHDVDASFSSFLANHDVTAQSQAPLAGFGARTVAVDGDVRVGLKFKSRTGNAVDVYTAVTIYVNKVRQ
jgi:hypothetical protein